MDYNIALKKEMLKRLHEVKNQEVSRYLHSFEQKLDAAGGAAGAWLEQLEARWGQFSAHPQGVTARFQPKDFDDLRYVIFGTRE